MKSVKTAGVVLVTMFLPISGVRSQDTPARAFDNVIIHTADGRTIDNGTIVWRDGVIREVGADLEIPFDAYVMDGGDSLHAYPGFIDGLGLWGSPELPEEYDRPEKPGEPGYDRAGIQPHRHPSALLEPDHEDYGPAEAQKLGFTTAALGLKGYMLPGQLDLFFLNGSRTGEYLYRKGIALHTQFEEAPGSFLNGAYPTTRMGIMAKLRQLWYDAAALKSHEAYYAAGSGDYPPPDKNEVLEALFPAIDGQQPLYFLADTEENIERVFRLKDELGFQLVLVSGREAYRKAEELRRRGIPVLASIDLPEKPEWKVKEEQEAAEEPGEEQEMEITEEMRIFRDKQLAAYRAHIDNIRKLIEAGVKVGYASNGLDACEISVQMRTLKQEAGLSDAQIIAMFTQNTADILGSGSSLGDLEKGRIASFSVFTKPFTEEGARVKYSVSNGRMTEFDERAFDETTIKECKE